MWTCRRSLVCVCLYEFVHDNSNLQTGSSWERVEVVMQASYLASAHTYSNDYVKEVMEENDHWETTSKWWIGWTTVCIAERKEQCWHLLQAGGRTFWLLLCAHFAWKMVAAHWGSHELWLSLALREDSLFPGFHFFSYCSISGAQLLRFTIYRMDIRMDERLIFKGLSHIRNIFQCWPFKCSS